MRKMIGAILSVSFFLTGCMKVGPTYVPPQLEPPCEWHTPLKEDFNTEPLDYFLWWESLNDPVLTSLIQRGVLNNCDIALAISRIFEARAMGLGPKANLYPHIDATLNFGHAHFSNKIFRDIFKKRALKGSQRDLNIFEVGFDVDWEIDLFGKNQHEMQAACADLEASVEGMRDALVSLSAEIARNYIELRARQASLELNKKHIESQRETLELTKGLVNAGFSSTIAQSEVETQLYLLTGQKPLIELAIQQTIHRLSILLGGMPGDLFCELTPVKCLPEIPCNKPVGIPSELLRNRPDIRKAERELAAATERVGSAIAEFFPRFSLKGFIGDLASNSHGGFAWFAGPQLLAPIFNSRLIQQDVDLNKIKTERALVLYQKTVLGAFEETENALASFHHELERNQQLTLAKQESQTAYDQSFQLFEKGLKDYLEVLINQRALLNIEESLLTSQMQLRLSFITLYKALGGGWDVADCET